LRHAAARGCSRFPRRHRDEWAEKSQARPGVPRACGGSPRSRRESGFGLLAFAGAGRPLGPGVRQRAARARALPVLGRLPALRRTGWTGLMQLLGGAGVPPAPSLPSPAKRGRGKKREDAGGTPAAPRVGLAPRMPTRGELFKRVSGRAPTGRHNRLSVELGPTSIRAANYVADGKWDPDTQDQQCGMVPNDGRACCGWISSLRASRDAPRWSAGPLKPFVEGLARPRPLPSRRRKGRERGWSRPQRPGPLDTGSGGRGPRRPQVPGAAIPIYRRLFRPPNVTAWLQGRAQPPGRY